MKDRQNAVLDALQRAQQFLDENAAELTGVVDLAGARHRLDDVAMSFSRHAFNQDVGARGSKGETAKQRQLRLKLRREQMEPVALIARRNLRTVPEFAALQKPKPKLRGQAFLASARAMADAATIHSDILVAHGLPSSFIDDFKAAVTKLEGSLADREKNRTRRVGATEGLGLEEQNGRTVLSILDALVEQALASNESLLQAWRAARLIRARPGVTTPRSATPTPASSATSGSAPSPTVAATPTSPTPAPTAAAA